MSDAFGNVKLLCDSHNNGLIVDDALQVTTIHVLHNDGQIVLLRAHSHEQQDARMSQGAAQNCGLRLEAAYSEKNGEIPHNLDLTLKLLDFGFVEVLIVKQLDGDRETAASSLVHCAVIASRDLSIVG